MTKSRRAAAICRGCKAPIIWVKMGPRKGGTPGGMMPVDKDWLYGDHRRSLVVLDEMLRGKLLVKPGPEVLGREPHWGTCPARQRFKNVKPSS